MPQATLDNEILICYCITMHEVVVVQRQGGLRAALYFILDLAAIILLVGTAIYFYRFQTTRVPVAPTPAEHIILPDSGRIVPVYKS